MYNAKVRHWKAKHPKHKVATFTGGRWNKAWKAKAQAAMRKVVHAQAAVRRASKAMMQNKDKGKAGPSSSRGSKRKC